MTDRGQITKMLSLSLEKYINPQNDPRIYWAKEVTFDYATGHKVRVDYMRFNPVNNSISGIEKGDFYCYEIKSSVEDFRSKHGHNFIGDFNYYVMLESIYEKVKKDIPYGVGIHIPDNVQYNDDKKIFLSCPDRMCGCKCQRHLKCIKKPRRQNRTHPVSEMLLMMFRSAAREYCNREEQGDHKQIPQMAIDTGSQSHPYKCPACGNLLEVGYKHCIFCGQKLQYEEVL